MLDRRSGRALYRQLADALRAQITSGELPPGSHLPSESYLQASYDVSRDVARAAIAALRGEGLVVTERGRQSFVRKHLPLERVSAPPDASIRARMPTADQRACLDMPEGVPVLVVRTTGDEAVYAADRVELRYEP
jgi:DNA-binding GntR family transcriptional regulator